MIFYRIIFFLIMSTCIHANTHNTCSIKFNHKIIIQDLQLALTDAEKTRGLSNVYNVSVGMIFFYEKPRLLSFWMHNTHVALTIGFIDQKGKLFQIEDMTADTDSTHNSIKKASYALELPQGKFQSLGLKKGDIVTFTNCNLRSIHNGIMA